MNKEQLKRGNELQKYIEDIETKIEAAKAGLDYPEHVSINVLFLKVVPIKNIRSKRYERKYSARR